MAGVEMVTGRCLDCSIIRGVIGGTGCTASAKSTCSFAPLVSDTAVSSMFLIPVEYSSMGCLNHIRVSSVDLVNGVVHLPSQLIYRTAREYLR